MRRTAGSIASLGVLSALTVGAAAPQRTAAQMPTHAIRGVVKSISLFYVVLSTGSGKKAHEMTFVLNSSTEKAGDITIGAIASVRYRREDDKLVATAVSAQQTKQAKPRAAQITRG